MATEKHLLFGPFRLDPLNEQVWRGGNEITLRRKTFEVLRYMVERPARLITKGALLDAIWADVSVSDTMPAICVAELRRALGDEPRTPVFIETVFRRGYRFIAEVTTGAPQTTAAVAMPGPKRGAIPIFVGRDQELAKVREWYGEAAAGQRRIVFISGEPGIGKTTFLRAFQDSLGGEKVLIARGQCVEQYGAGEPYMPVLEALTRLAREPGGDRVVELMNRLAPSWLAQMPSLLSEADRERLQPALQGVTQQRMLREMGLALEALSAATPLVLAIEDLHWSDYSTLELIAALARLNEPARLMVIGTYRPVEMLPNDHPLRTMKSELELHHYCDELRLRLLTEAEVAAYLGLRFADDREHSFAQGAPRIFQRSNGNPLFMVNLVDYLIERGSLLDNGDSEAPHTIKQLVEQNLERLEPTEQQVLEAASVAGNEFSAAAVAAALERPVSEIEACCVRLARHEQFVTASGIANWPDGTIASSFRFYHPIYGEVLYDRVPAGHRVVLHRRIATREEAGYGERAADIAAELAHHYSRAANRELDAKVIHYLQLAGEKAVRSSANVEAIGHFGKALQLLSTRPETPERLQRELGILTPLGTCVTAVKGFSSDEARQTFGRARELSQRLGGAPQLFLVLFGSWLSHAARGDYDTAIELGNQCLRLADTTEDSGLKLEAYHALGVSYQEVGQHDRSLIHLDNVIALYDARQHQNHKDVYGHDPAVVCLMHAAWSLWLLGFPDQALAKSAESISMAKRLAHPSSWATVAAFLSCIHQWCGDSEGVDQLSATAIRISDENDFAYCRTIGAIMQGWVSAERGELEEGIGRMQASLEAFRAMGGLVLGAYFTGLLAETYARIKKPEEGLRQLKLLNFDAEPWWMAELYRLRGELTLESLSTGSSRRARETAAEECFLQAIEIARQQKARSLELRASMSWCNMWTRSHPKRKQIVHEVKKLYGWFTEGFETTDLVNAKRLISI